MHRPLAHAVTVGLPIARQCKSRQKSGLTSLRIPNKLMRTFFAYVILAALSSGCAIFKPAYNFTRVNGAVLNDDKLIMVVSVEKGYDNRTFGDHVRDIVKTDQRFYQLVFGLEPGKRKEPDSIVLIREIKGDVDSRMLPTSDFGLALALQFSNANTTISAWDISSAHSAGEPFVTDESTAFGAGRYKLSQSGLYMVTKGEGVVLTDLKSGKSEKITGWAPAMPTIEKLKIHSDYDFHITDDGKYLVAIPDSAFDRPTLVFDRNGNRFAWRSSVTKENGHSIAVLKAQSSDGQLCFLCKKTAFSKEAPSLGKSTLYLESLDHTIIGSIESVGQPLWDPKNRVILQLPMTVEFSPSSMLHPPLLWHYRQDKKESTEIDVSGTLIHLK